MVPEEFISIILDFANDILRTFPECRYMIERWTGSEGDFEKLYRYAEKLYPERFFDILYQNEAIFEMDSVVNTFFFPGLDFKLLFGAPDITSTTKTALWKYLQLVLLNIVGSLQNNQAFGKASNLFENANEEELQEKIKETLESIQTFFKENASSETSSEPSSIPQADFVHEHLKGLFEGKIGNLAKELASDLSDELLNSLKGENVSSTQDIFKHLMRNPQRFMGMMKTITKKLETKMKNGEISEAELMDELQKFIGKMKPDGSGSGSSGDMQMFRNLFLSLSKNMQGKPAASSSASSSSSSASASAAFVNNVFSMAGEEGKQPQSTRPAGDKKKKKSKKGPR
jgi:hypothetical protein